MVKKNPACWRGLCLLNDFFNFKFQPHSNLNPIGVVPLELDQEKSLNHLILSIYHP